MARTEVEEEMERLIVLSSEISDAACLEPSTLGRFLASNRGNILKALDYYEKRLKTSMNAAQKDSYRPPFNKSEKELELVEAARKTLSA